MSTEGMPYKSWENQRRRRKGVEETFEATMTKDILHDNFIPGKLHRAMEMYALTKPCVPMLIAALFINQCPKLVTTQTFTCELTN